MNRDDHSLATPMPARQTLIQEDTSYRILRILQANPESKLDPAVGRFRRRHE